MNENNETPEEGQDGRTIIDQYVPDTTEVAEDQAGYEADSFVEEEPTNRNSATGLITVTCGANTSAFGEISGKSIADLRSDLADVLNIAPDAKAVVSGEEVDEDYVLVPGDRVEFIKASGKKG